MTRKCNAPHPGQDAGRKGNTSEAKHSKFRAAVGAGIKSAIVRLALMGVIPACLADWLIQRGGLKHE